MIFSILQSVSDNTQAVLQSPTGPDNMFERPAINGKNESNIPGLYIIGDLAGAPVIKLAMAQGHDVIEEISSLPGAKGGKLESEGIYDVIVVGAGASGLNAALAAQEKGLSCLIIEKGKIAQTIENFPEGKWVYAEPDKTPPKGKLWLDGSTKENLVERWNQIVEENNLNLRTGESLTALSKGSDGVFDLETSAGKYRAQKVVLATGQRGNPRKLNVPGEDREEVYHRLYSPRKYKDENILVVGGGNSAIEAAVTLSEQNKVTLSYRKGEFGRVFQDNQRKLNEAIEAGRIEVLFHSQVKEFGEGNVTLEITDGEQKGEKTIPYHHAFVLIGAELPVKFLKNLGVRLENEWQGSALAATLATVGSFLGFWLYNGNLAGVGIAGLVVALLCLLGLCYSGKQGNRYAWLGVSFIIWYAVYGIKVGKGQEFWPFTGWGYELLSVFERPWSFWYTTIYTLLMTVFGMRALNRWGLKRKDAFQIFRYSSLIAFQWIFFFIIPEFLFQYAIQYQWVGESLATDPTFADQGWRSYGLIYAWPLFFYTFFYDPHQIWIVWGVLLTFVVIPLLVLFHGKRYCSWICGCGGLAETFGDQWRHLAPKGKRSIALEKVGGYILVLAILVTVGMLIKDVVGFIRSPTEWAMWFYRIVVDVWLVGLLPLTLYPFLGGKVWCRYWCPLAKMMQYTSALFARFGKSRFGIEANDKCISCGECSRYCQVGIDVMSYALKQDRLDNLTTSCIGCGICVSVCPMDTLSFSSQDPRLVQIGSKAA